MVISSESLCLPHLSCYDFLEIFFLQCSLSSAGFSDNAINKMLIKNNGSIYSVAMVSDC